MSPNLSQAPEAIKKINKDNINNLDVRPILQSGGEPFAEIMAAVEKTSPQGALRLRATFEPKPLFRVLGSQGWKHWVEYGAGEDWMIWFYQEQDAAPVKVPDSLMNQYPELSKRLKMEAKEWTLNVRDLPPPEPMEMTLAVLGQLPKGVSLRQLNQRVPQFLLPLLAERGMQAEILKEQENNVEIAIKHL